MYKYTNVQMYNTGINVENDIINLKKIETVKK